MDQLRNTIYFKEQADQSFKTNACPPIQRVPIDHPNTCRRPEIMKNFNHQTKQQSMKATGAEELVKFMSDVPCYLQRTGRGGNIQEKALNFGVLDWNYLERWSSKQGKGGFERNLYSSSSSGFSSSSASGSSTKSHRITKQTVSNAQKMPLDFYLNISAKESHSEDLKEIFSKDDASSNNSKDKHIKHKLMGRKCRIPEGEKGNINELGFSVEKCQSLKSASSKLSDHSLRASVKGKTMALAGHSQSKTKRGPNTLSENRVDHLDAYSFLSIREHPDDRSPDGCSHYGPSIAHDIKAAETTSKIFTEDFHFDFSLSSDIPRSCPFPCTSHSDGGRGEFSVDSQDPEIFSDVRHSYSYSGEMPMHHTINKHVDRHNQFMVRPSELPRLETFDGVDPGSVQTKATAVTKESISPHQNSAFSLDKTPRSFSFREASATPQLDSGVRPTFTRSNSSNRDKSNDCCRAKSSPLRRVFDPLLRLRTAKNLTSDKLLSGSLEDNGMNKKESKVLSSRNRDKSSKGRHNSSTSPSVKRNLNFSTFKSTNLHVKNVGLKKHALLQLDCKNKQPLFTFNSNDSEFLADMMSKVNDSGMGNFEWIYTFHSIHEVRKNRWSKSESCSSVVAQMKVSFCHVEKQIDGDFDNYVSVREFVLFEIDDEINHEAHETSDLVPTKELAAIIIRFPEDKECFCDVGHQSGSTLVKQSKWFSLCKDSISLVENEIHSKIIAVLPDGVHSHPATAGMPSSLIERWKSGGSCDCGGWDEGCLLRVLSSQSDEGTVFTSLDVFRPSDDSLHVDLFCQGRAQGDRHFFSLTHLKGGCYSIEFNESISLLQAFSISLAILHGQKQASYSELLDTLQTKCYPEPVEIDRTVPSRTEGTNPTSYFPYPPNSPVGRV